MGPQEQDRTAAVAGEEQHQQADWDEDPQQKQQPKPRRTMLR
jgi:hypothetical protein